MAMGKKCEGECERERESEREMKARMRETMIECSRSGNIDGLYLAMEEYPELLEEIDESKFVNTPLHEAAAAGKTEFAVEILNLMPSFGKKLNPKGLSPLHLAIETGNFDTALELVEIDKQLVLVKGLDLLKMMVDIVKINKQNNNWETPLDVAATEEAKIVLRKAGGKEGKEIGKKPSTVDYLLAKHSKNYVEALTRAFYFLTKEMTLELRNTILVVAVLIATATYQGVLSPPGGLFSAEGNIDVHRLSDTTDHEKAPAAAGTMVMRRSDYKYFMPTNTMAFILSNAMIIFVLPGRFFLIILRASLLFMCISYLLALKFISESNRFSRNMLFASSCALILDYLLKVAYYVVKAYYAGRSWFLRRLKVMVSNRCSGMSNLCSGMSNRYSGMSNRDSGKHTRPRPRPKDMSVFKRMRKQYKLIKTD